MRNYPSFLLGASILVLTACGGDPGETTTDGSTGATSSGSTTDPTTNPTTNPSSPSTTGVEDTTTAGTGTSETSPTTTGEPETTSTSTTGESGTTTTEGTTSGTTEPVDTTTTDGTTTDGTTTGGTTGEPAVCDGLPAMECMANEACMPLGGGKLNLQKMCVGKPMFLGCVDAGACGDALTYACDSAVEPPEPHLFPSTCLPEGWEPCEAPPIDMPCK